MTEKLIELQNVIISLDDDNQRHGIMASIALLVGIACILVGIFQHKFYATLGLSGMLTNKLIDPNVARFFFVLVGIIFTIIGMYLFGN